MCTMSPGATSIPHRLTGTCTPWIACGPWPAQMPRVRYWNFIGRISWMSRDGPLVTAPIAPQARRAEVMLPPDSPTLSASSAGKALLEAEDGGSVLAVRRLQHVHQRNPGVAGIGNAVGAGDRVAGDRAQLRVPAHQPVVGVPVRLPGVVQLQAQFVSGIGGHHVGDGGGIDLLELFEQCNVSDIRVLLGVVGAIWSARAFGCPSLPQPAPYRGTARTVVAHCHCRCAGPIELVADDEEMGDSQRQEAWSSRTSATSRTT